jgi:hypothetical protein
MARALSHNRQAPERSKHAFQVEPSVLVCVYLMLTEFQLTPSFFVMRRVVAVAA